ncbi:hypothetical protein [Aquifex aeolicus]|uniref:Uncharacterized protein aq_1923 n=1 Tax=Aquifex aeolicus (strain VF5) TaxID=224324 RepID=Y1923_AQUAE|nr:hypothetical protein [Aquifex aeolicus]O67752.1 RecName: Full=Uncharacterized protein aq_1923; Flags: Precursor [Aquifex aeolicus VF5]AAC07719.1 putative protein [Aquifex aeolicus VF5]
MKKALGILAILLILVGGYFAYDKYMDNKAKEQVEYFLDKTLRKSGKGSYKYVDYKPIGGEIIIKDVYYRDRNGEEFKIEEIIIEKLSETEGKFLFKNVKPLKVKGKGLLEEYGYKDPKFNLFVSYEAKPKEKEFHLRSLSLDYPEAFEVNISFILGNYDHAFWKTVALSDRPPEEVSFQVLSELGSIKINSLEVVYRDKGFKERVIKKEAQKRGKTPEEFKKELIRKIEEEKLKARSEFERNLLDAFEKFLEKGKEIKVVIKPNPPLKIQDLFVVAAVQKDERELLKLLNPVIEVK